MQLTGMAAIAVAAFIGAAVCVHADRTAAAAESSMPTTLAEALRLEAADALPITRFYETPRNIAVSKSGELLREEAITEYQLPAGATAVRILYRSTDAGGTAVTSSAAVLIPAGSPPTTGWPLIIFAHGTSGVARECAPSAMKDLYYGPLGLLDFIKAGFAVVAVDYHGLGTEGPHQYINKVAQAHDVINAVPAARAAVPSLGRRWVVDGHSQGGLAAWGVAEQEALLKQPEYLGAVAVAAATLHDGWLVAHPDTTRDAGFYLAWLGYGIKARFRRFDVHGMLTPAGLAHYEDITTHGCWFNGYAAYLGTDAPAMTQPGWDRNPWVRKFFAENRAGAKPIAGPLLALAGEADVAVPLGAVRDVVDRACRNHLAISFRSYPGYDHEPTMANTTADQIAWIRDRFAGKLPQANCTS